MPDNLDNRNNWWCPPCHCDNDRRDDRRDGRRDDGRRDDRHDDRRDDRDRWGRDNRRTY